LPVRCRGDATLVGEHAQERLHLRRAHRARMPMPCPAQVVPHPEDVRVLGAQAVVQVAQALAQRTEQRQARLRLCLGLRLRLTWMARWSTFSALRAVVFVHFHSPSYTVFPYSIGARVTCQLTAQ